VPLAADDSVRVELITPHPLNPFRNPLTAPLFYAIIVSTANVDVYIK
jgi:hypothetical protein